MRKYPGVAVDGGAVGELKRLAEVRLEPAHERQLFAGRRLLHFFGGRAFTLEPLDHRVGGNFEIGERMPGRGVIETMNSPTSSDVFCPAFTDAAACSSNTSALVRRAVRGPDRIAPSTDSANRSSFFSPTVGHWM